MVNSISIVLMGITAVMSFLVPIFVFIYFKKKEKINFKLVIAGIVVFIVFTQILEKLLHFVIIGNNLIPNPIWFTVYGALAAGLFEEGGRFIAFKTIFKNKHEWKDGLAYGIGHGGIEAILYGVAANVQSIIYSNLINKGLFETVLCSKADVSQANQFLKVKELLIQNPVSFYIITFPERIFALGIQIALTMVVLYAVRYRKNIYLLIAILLHALMDIPAALYQMKIVNVYFAEGMLLVYFIISMIFLCKTKKNFSKEAMTCNTTLND